MDFEKEIHLLRGEAIAAQVIIVHVCRALVARDPALRQILEIAFGDAINELEGFAIKFGREASPDHLLKATQIAEQIRDATLGSHKGPHKIV